MKTSLKAGVFGVLALASLAPGALAEDDAGPFSGGVTLTSDYRFRGQSQTDRAAAIQGWVQYDHASGLFANIWASNIDFNDEPTLIDPDNYDSSIEVDLTVGYSREIMENTTAGIKAVYYLYPDADTPPASNDYDYFELLASVEHDYGKAAVSAELAWSPDYFLESGDAVSLKGGVSVPLMEKFIFMDALTASANLGYQWIDDNDTFGTDDYLYFDFGVSAGWEIFTVDLRWVDTDLETADCFGGLEVCDGGVVLSLTADIAG
ncbi:MAG: TorF family putative porin [Micropepsaceae bacterium]